MSVYPYRFQNFHIPNRMMGAIALYVESRKAPGGFLTAVICNDLKEACGRADDENLRNLPAFVAYFHNEAPSACWGSEEKMRAWLAREDVRARSRSGNPCTRGFAAVCGDRCTDTYCEGEVEGADPGAWPGIATWRRPE